MKNVRKRVLVVALLLIVAGGLQGSFLTFAQATNLPENLLGLQPEELHARLGEPDYIKVFDYGAAQKYAYFTPSEWKRIADMAPLVHGDDVYIMEEAGVRWQYHFSFTPVYLDQERFKPAFRIKEYTIYPETDVSLAQLIDYLPQARLLKEENAEAYFQEFQTGYPPALIVQTPGNSSSLEKYFRRFRERGELNLQLEIGLQNGVSIDTLTGDTRVSYITVKAGVLDKEPSRRRVSIAKLF